MDGIDPTGHARLRARAREDQHQAALRDFLHNRDAERCRPLVGLLIGHPPNAEEWGAYETLHAAFLYSVDADMITMDIAQVTEFSLATIRRMAECGHLPAPRYRGKWWSNRAEITECLAQRERD